MKSIVLAVAAAVFTTTTSAWADGIKITDAYLRSSTPTSASGAAFLVIENLGATDDRLIAAASDIAGRVELHTHLEDADGVMKMIQIEGGIFLPAGEMHHLKRGGDHVMFMGLNQPLVQGESIAVTLTFENAGDIVVTVPVDHERKPAHGGHSDH